MIQTISQEGEKSETEFIAFDEDNGSVLASESLGNKIAFINGSGMAELDDLQASARSSNVAHENLSAKFLIFNRGGKRRRRRREMVTKMAMAKRD